MASDNAKVSAIQVEVAYARPDEQAIIAMEVPEGATLEQAIVQSRIQERFPEIQLQTAKVGVFGKPANCRPLCAPATGWKSTGPCWPIPRRCARSAPPRASECARAAANWSPTQPSSPAVVDAVERVAAEEQDDVALFGDVAALAVLVVIIPAVLMERVGDQRSAQEALHLLFGHAGTQLTDGRLIDIVALANRDGIETGDE